MEMDESITNDESQKRNVYGSLINPEERKNSEASEGGDNPRGKLSFIVEFIGGIFASAVICRMKFTFSSSLYRVSFRT